MVNGPPAAVNAASSDGAGLEWVRPLVHAATRTHGALDVSWGPKLGGVTVFSEGTGHRSSLVLKRWSRDGERRWTRRWAGPRDVKRLLPEAVTATSWKAAIYVAGNATCRIGGPGRGPYFVRKYGVHGKPVWTRWDGRCPSRPNDSLPVSSKVTDLDVAGEYLAISGAHEGLCCDEGYRDGFVDLYSLDGRRMWHRDIDVPGHGGASDSALAVDVGVSEILVGGWVEAQPVGATPGTIDTDAYAMALVPWDRGRVRWAHVVDDQGPADFDAYTAVGHGGQRLFFAGVLDRPLTGGDGRAFLEQRNGGSGALIWQDTWPLESRVTSIDGLGNDASIATGTVVENGAERVMLRRYLPDGALQWSTTWGRAAAALELEAFSMNRKSGLGVGRVTEAGTGEIHARLWKWRW
jgi:hypothetical protein